MTRTDRAGAIGCGMVAFSVLQAFVGRIIYEQPLLPWWGGGGLALAGVVLATVGAIGAVARMD